MSVQIETYFWWSSIRCLGINSTICHLEANCRKIFNKIKAPLATKFYRTITSKQSAVDIKEALSVLMLCMANNCWRTFSYHTKMADLEYFHLLSIFSWKNWQKLRKVYWICQVVTVRSINHNVGALKELSCQMLFFRTFFSRTWVPCGTVSEGLAPL